MQTIEVAALTGRIQVIAAQHPSLALLDGDERLRPIARNLFMVGRLTDPRAGCELRRGIGVEP
ncbi:MAG: hypothetical protein M3P06_05290 [Acidobacteriota bacterium]|nr:hypothetical protein [Acidobacteriota bacterium]